MTTYFNPESSTFVHDFHGAIGTQTGERHSLLVYTPNKGFSFEERHEYSWLSRVFSSSKYDYSDNFLLLAQKLQYRQVCLLYVPQVALQEVQELAMVAEKMRSLASSIEKRRKTVTTVTSLLQETVAAALEKEAELTGQPRALLACRIQAFDVALQHLKGGDAYQSVDQYKEQLLQVALQQSEFIVAVELLERGGRLPQNSSPLLLNQLLCIACQQQRPHTALQILERPGFRIEAPAEMRYVLHLAIENRASTALVQRLCDCGAERQRLEARNLVYYGQPPKITPLALSIELRRFDLVPVLLTTSVQANELHPISRRPLVVETIECGEEKAALLFVEKGFDSTYKDPEGRTLLHLAALHNMPQLQQLLLQSGVAVGAQDNKKNTAAHLAAACSHFTLLPGMLQAGLDPTITNINGHTFLAELGTIDRIKCGFQALGLPYFSPETAIGNLPAGYNPLESCFLLQSHGFAAMISSRLTQAQFDLYLWKLKAKYPKFSIDSVALAPYQVNEAHMKKAFDLSKIPEKPKGVELQRLMQIFDTIPFTTTCKPGDYSDDLKGLSFQEFRSLITMRIVHRVKNRVADAGSGPSNTPKHTYFYDKLESALMHTIVKLQAMGSDAACLQKKAAFFCDLAIAAPFCGTPLLQVATDHYNSLVRSIPVTVENYTFSQLTAARTTILMQQIDQRDPFSHDGKNHQTTHDWNQLLYLAGREFGIEGADAVSDPDQIGQKRHKSKSLVLDRAMLRYGVTDIIDILAPCFTDTDFWRSKVRGYIIEHAPKHWKAEKYDPIYARIGEMRAQSATPQQLKMYLESCDIYYQAGTAEEAIKADQGGDYFENGALVDPNQHRLQRTAIARILQDFGILQPLFVDSRPKRSFMETAMAVPAAMGSLFYRASNYVRKMWENFA